MIRFLLPLSIFLVACSSAQVDSSEPGQYDIRCEGSVLKCHEKARSTCSDGYLVTNRVRPVRKEDHTEFHLHVRCRNSSF